MKNNILYIEARKIFGKDIDLSVLNNLPKQGKTISLAATVQYIGLIPKIKAYLEKQGKKVILKQGSKYQAHVLGCQSQAFDKKADILLLITDGKFHGINNAIQLDKEIYIYNTKTLDKISEQDLDKIKQKTKAKINKFLSFKNIGLLVSTKHGQKHQNIEKITEKIKNKNKKPYVFESDTIDLNELENFPQIKIWINTACYGLALDNQNIINLQDIAGFL